MNRTRFILGSVTRKGYFLGGKGIRTEVGVGEDLVEVVLMVAGFFNKF